jgi:hypothetical protein
MAMIERAGQQKDRAMPDPEVQTPPEFQYYVERHGIRYDYSKPRTQMQLQQDVNVLHDFTKKLLTEKDRMKRVAELTQITVRNQRIWTRVLTAAVVAQFAVLIELLKIVLDRLK